MNAEQIVQALAQSSEPKNEGGSGDGYCLLCDATGVWMGESHDPTCPWRLAQEWIAANPPRPG
jgi:hypothetical protein